MHRASLNSQRRFGLSSRDAWGVLSILVHPFLIKILYYFLLVYRLFFSPSYTTIWRGKENSNLISGRSSTVF